MKIIICEDEKKTANEIEAHIKNCAQKLSIEVEIEKYFNAEALLDKLADKPNAADIIYMDIIMGRVDGISATKSLRKLGCNSFVVFITSSNEYIYDAFDVNASYYFIKNNYTKEKFFQVFKKAVETALQKKEEFLSCEKKGESTLIPLHTILYLEIFNRVVTVQHTNGTLSFYSRFEVIDNKLSGKGFVRVHRSYIVNMAYIIGFKPKSVVLKNGINIPLGANYQQSVKNNFSSYLTSSRAEITFLREENDI